MSPLNPAPSIPPVPLAPVQLLCLPCAGASAMMYLRWRNQLPRGVTLVPVELPGHGSRLAEPFVESFERLVERLCTEQSRAMRDPFVLFGHSMGGLLAYGITRRLQALGQPLPRALLVSGCAAPTRRDRAPYPGKNDDASLTTDLRRQGGTPEAVFESAELMRLTLDTLGADYRVCESFVRSESEPLPLPLHVFAGQQDDIAADRMQAWSLETGRAFTLDWFEGGHFFIRHEEASFLRALSRRLEALS